MLGKIFLASTLMLIVSYADNYPWQYGSSDRTAWGYYSFSDQYNAMARPPLQSMLSGNYNSSNQSSYNQPSRSRNQPSYGTNANSKTCTPNTVDYAKCLETDPDGEVLEWRFIRHIGWTKLTKYGATRKDWWDYRKTLGWPFHPTYGLLPR